MTPMNPEPNPDNIIATPRRPRGEIIDLATREVWQALEPTPLDWWKALDLDAPLVKAGLGRGNMDQTWFRRSPDAAEDGPLRTREIAGRTFFYCARAPVNIPTGIPRRMNITAPGPSRAPGIRVASGAYRSTSCVPF